MMRNVYLEGELGAKFGNHFRMDCDSAQEILKNISANREEFKPYLVECVEKNINLDIIFDGEELDEEGCVTHLKEGDVTILVVPSGSKNGIGKLFAAAAPGIAAAAAATGVVVIYWILLAEIINNLSKIG